MYDVVEKTGVVPVIVLEKEERAVPLAKAMIKGGIPIMEITFRTKAAKASISSVVKQVPEMLVGAGTVVTMKQFEEAVEAGAKFIVSPGFDAEIVSAAQKKGLPVFPGIVTPSEILAGLKFGVEIFKFFPAGNYGGVSTIKALSGPFPQIKFLPTGGISTKNAADYYACKQVIAVGGSWMAPANLIEAEEYEQITQKCKEAVELYKISK